jgi:lipopolysaccharide export LptBFGC system permease protein LptF
MTKLILVILLFFTNDSIFAQSKQELQNYITKNLSYQHVDTKSSKINIYKIEFNDCRMSYTISKKVNAKTERYKVWIDLSRNSKIEMVKNAAGLQTIIFAGSTKSMFKEYPNGDLVYDKIEIIPLKIKNPKALDYFKKLIKLCKE